MNTENLIDEPNAVLKYVRQLLLLAAVGGGGYFLNGSHQSSINSLSPKDSVFITREIQDATKERKTLFKKTDTNTRKNKDQDIDIRQAAKSATNCHEEVFRIKEFTDSLAIYLDKLAKKVLR